jgi:hypothetical protein
MWVRTDQHPPLNLLLVRLNFWKMLLLSAYIVIVYMPVFSCSLFSLLFYSSICNALQFGEFRPFVNVTAVPRSRIYAEKYKNHVMWSGQNRSVIFTMLGSVQGCHLVEPTTIGQYTCKAITIIPYGEAWRRFQVFMGDLYGHGPMRGPFEYGCLLTLSGRREGYTSPGMLSFSSIFLLMSILFPNLDNFGMSNPGPVTPKKNMKAFGGSGAAAASSEWFDVKLQNCIDFDKPSMSFCYQIVITMLIK